MAKATNRFLSKLTLEDLDGNQWKLLAPLVYQRAQDVGGQKTRYVVPEGFVTDLASIPSFIFWRSKSGNYNEAAVLHDACYAGTVTITPPAAPLTRGEADGLFQDAMAALGVGWWTRRVLYRSVRLGGWRSWRKYRNAESEAPHDE
jgi:hypothetical protein